ncbi:MAG: DUF5011 domain-containing protein [Candidatus Taylorbacteria bacterium]|nr:DUF5011 domain-containing protein [Candidatus Taylorbacteria bacterium]
MANTMVAGPATSGNVANGGNSIQRPDGKFLIVHGNTSTGTSIYDPIANTMVAGPATSGNVLQGSHSIQRPDGKFLILHGANSTGTSIYDPVANTMVAGPATSDVVGTGSHSIQRPDGKFLIVRGQSSTGTSIYDVGWATTGSYESEALNLPKLNPSSVIKWNSNGEGIIEVAVKLAGSQAGLGGATYATTTNGALIYHSATTTPTWARVRVTLTRPIPTNNQPYNRNVNSNVWLGLSDTKYYRNFAQPTVYDFTIDNSSVFRKENADFGSGFATTSTNIATGNATSSGPTLINLLGGDGGLSLPYGWTSASTTATSTTLNGYFASSSPLLGTSGNSAASGAFSLQRQDGQFLTVLGNNTSNTSIYNPFASTSAAVFSAGPALVGTSASLASSSAFAIQRPDGKFLVILGNNTADTSIYDPVANSFTAGPALAGSTANKAGAGAHAIQRPDGKFMIVLGNNTLGTTVYDPVANTFASSSPLVGTAANLAYYGAHSLLRPDGKFLVILGNDTANTSIYDPVASNFIAGPSVIGTVGGPLVGGGAHSLQRPDGKFLLIMAGSAATSSTAIYDPVANTWSAGPAIIGTSGSVASYGAHSFQRSDGKFQVILGGNTLDTSLYDPVANSLSPGQTLGTLNASQSGAHSFQRPDGKYITVIGNNTSTTTLMDAGWVTEGSYTSETIYNTALDSTSALVWTGNADAFKPGAVSVRVRTGSSINALATTTWRTIPVSGGLISPNSSDTWMQVQIQMHRTIPSQPNSLKNVWLGESSVVYNRLPLQAGAGIPSVNQAQVFSKPTITSYRVVNSDNADLANFTLNGQSLFRFSAGGEAFTGGGAWNAGGADVAEYFPTDDYTLEAGDIVSILIGLTSQNGLVERSRGPYDQGMVGIVSTNPGVKLGSDISGGHAGKQPIALAGRVPVKVSLDNGPIKKGDFLTSSNRPGIAMKATDAGRVIALALEDFTLDDSASGKATLLAYVNPIEWAGEGGFFSTVGKKLSLWTTAVTDVFKSLNLFAEGGKLGIGTAPLKGSGSASTTTTAMLSIESSDPDTAALVLQGKSGQRANLLEVHSLGPQLGGETSKLDVVGDGTAAGVVVINHSGSVGIGTTDPEALLEIVSPSSTSTALLIRGSSASGVNLVEVRASRLSQDGTTTPLGSTETAIFAISPSGQVGIGTSTPASLLSVSGPAPELSLYDTNDGGHFKLRHGALSPGTFDLYDAKTGQSRFSIDSSGRVFIGLAAPKLGVEAGLSSSTPALLTVGGSVAASSFIVTSATPGVAQSASSTPLSNTVLDTLRSIPISVSSPSGLNSTVYSLASISSLPDSVLSVDRQGADLLKFSTFLLAGLQAEDTRLTLLDTRLASVETFLSAFGFSTSTPATTTSTNFSTTSIQSFFSSFGAEIGVGVARFKSVIVEAFTVGSASKASGITLYDTVTKAPYCLTIENGVTKSTAGECSGTAVPAPSPATAVDRSDLSDTTPPVITITGANPAYLNIGQTYIDLGATVEDDVNHNLGVRVTGDTTVDTSIADTYLITYTAADQAGNTATTTRTVIVKEPLTVDRLPLTEENNTQISSSTGAETDTVEENPEPESIPEPTPTPTPTTTPTATTIPTASESSTANSQPSTTPEPINMSATEPEPTPTTVPAPESAIII